jgi:hypothetical protein
LQISDKRPCFAGPNLMTLQTLAEDSIRCRGDERRFSAHWVPRIQSTSGILVDLTAAGSHHPRCAHGSADLNSKENLWCTPLRRCVCIVLESVTVAHRRVCSAPRTQNGLQNIMLVGGPILMDDASMSSNAGIPKYSFACCGDMASMDYILGVRRNLRCLEASVC